MKPLLKIVLDKRRVKEKSGKYPVKLRVTSGKEQKYYSVDIDLTIDEFDLVESINPLARTNNQAFKRRLTEWKIKCLSISTRANEVVNALDPFTFLQFERKMFQTTILRRSEAPTEFIWESLGHTSTKTTSNYLDSFENAAKMEWAKMLTE